MTCSRSTSSAWRSAIGSCRWSTRRRAAICWRASRACAASSRRISASSCRRCTSATTSICRRTPIASISPACRSGEGVDLSGARARDQSRARCSASLSGIETRDPAFGMEAVWIEPVARDHAQTLGYTVVDASTVIATHLSHVIQTHAHELLGHEEVQQLLNALAKTAPKLVEDLTPRLLPLGIVVRVLQGLLAERVPIRNMRTIVETLAEHAARTQDPAAAAVAGARRARPADRAGHRRHVDRAAGHHARARSRTVAEQFARRRQRRDARASSPASPNACSADSPKRRSARK